MGHGHRRLRVIAAVLALVTAAAGCGSTAKVPQGGSPAGDAPAGPAGAGRAGKAAPRWVPVAILSGTGSQRTADFTITATMLQWRVTATCDSGHVRVGLVGDPEALVEQGCPGRFFGFSIRAGSQRLEIAATGRWEAVVEEQVDEPLAEPPLPGMTERSRLAGGTFVGVEQQGEGAATLHELPDGRRVLRLDPFFVTPNDDLFVWVSEAPAPRTSADALFTPHVQLEALKATAGPQNYVLPDSLPADRVRSIVIWCEPVRTAYAAAPLRRR